MKKAIKKWAFVLAVLAVMVILFARHETKVAKATVTGWWKIPPASCSVYLGGSDTDQLLQATYGTLKIRGGLAGAISAYAYCPAFLPDGAQMNKLRIRSFQTGAIPDDSYVSVRLRRRTWNGSATTLATAVMYEDETYKDANFSSTVSNENYQYVFELFFYKTSSATDEPELDMIEIRYEI